MPSELLGATQENVMSQSCLSRRRLVRRRCTDRLRWRRWWWLHLPCSPTPSPAPLPRALAGPSTLVTSVALLLPPTPETGQGTQRRSRWLRRASPKTPRTPSWIRPTPPSQAMRAARVRACACACARARVRVCVRVCVSQQFPSVRFSYRGWAARIPCRMRALASRLFGVFVQLTDRHGFDEVDVTSS